MSGKEKGSKADVRYIPLGSEIDGDQVHNLGVIFAPDRTIAEEVATEVSMEAGATSWNLQEVNRRGEPKGKRHFFFSGATWSAPWNPAGPKPTEGSTVTEPPQRSN